MRFGTSPGRHLVFRTACATLVASAFASFSPLCTAQSADALWRGQVQCTLVVQSDEYVHQETQTWKLAGPPAMSGEIAVYPASWSVGGQGAMQRTVNGQVLSGSWKTSAAPMNATIAIFVRASDHRLVIKSYHAQLYAANAIVLTRQVSIAGAAPSQSNLQLAAFEWQMPLIEDAGTTTTLNGSGTMLIAGSLLPQHPAATNEKANCTWQFAKGGPAPNSATRPDLQSGTMTPPTSLMTGSVNSGTPQTTTSVPVTSNGPSVQAAPSGSASPATKTPRTPLAVPSTPLKSTAGTGTSSSSSGTQSNSTVTEAGHSWSTASGLNDVRGDSGADVDARTSSWSSAGQDDYYRFSVVRSVKSITWPPLYAKITVSGLQSEADFDLNLYNLQGGSTTSPPFFTISHTGSASFTVSITEDSTTDAVAPANIAVVLHSRTIGPYQLTITGNQQGGALSQIPMSKGLQGPTYAPFPVAPSSLGVVSGNIGTSTISSSGTWVSGSQDTYYQFTLSDNANMPISPPPLKATMTISGLQSGADFDVTGYTTQLGSNAKYGTITHTSSAPLVVCITAAVDIQKIFSTDVVIGIHSRSAGPYQITVAGNTSGPGCQSTFALPSM